MKKIFWFKIIPVLVLLGAALVFNKYSWQGDDFSILSIDGDKVKLVNISPERGMVNIYDVANMDLWIPNGMGWYPAERLGLIVKDDVNLAKKITFYNFGFWPNQVSLAGKWDGNQSLWSMLGPFGFVRFKFSQEDWLWKDDDLKGQNYSEVIPRDLSNNRVMSNNVRINIINASGKNGFGNMMADRLEWYGLMVLSTQTAEVEKDCRLFFDFNGREKSIMQSVAQILGCKTVNRVGVVELVLGEDLAQMIKYSQTYVRAF